MKKFLFFVMCFIAVSSVKAQRLGFDEKSNFGISFGLVANYLSGDQDPREGLSAELNFNKIIVDLSVLACDLKYEKDYSTYVINLGYKINSSKFSSFSKLNIYPLLGAAVNFYGGEGEFDFNYGLGAQYSLTRNLFVTGKVSKSNTGAGIGLYL